MTNDMYSFIENLGKSGETNTPEMKTFDPDEYRQKKEQERRETFDLLDAATVEAVSSNEDFSQYIRLQARLNYTVANTLLVFKQKPDAVQLKEFDDWKADGVSIKKNSKAIRILEPTSARTREGEAFTGFNVKKVLDISQTNALPVNQKREIPDKRTIMYAVSSIVNVELGVTDQLPDNRDAMYGREQRTIYLRRGLNDLEVVKGVITEAVRANIVCEQPEIQEDILDFQTMCGAYLVEKDHGMAEKDVHIDVPDAVKKMKPKEIRKILNKPVELRNQIREAERQILQRAAEKPSLIREER